MIKISTAVNQIIEQDEVALTALSQGWLNLSGYANTIHKQVGQLTKKLVRHGSIVTALSRLTGSNRKQKTLLPKIQLINISAKSGLIEIALDKTLTNQKLATGLYANSKFSQNNFYTVTQGVNELSIIADRKVKNDILRLLKNEKPKFILENLSALTISFGHENIFIPNTTFALVRILAIKRINIIEVVSTFTELTFILEEHNLQTAFALFGALMK